MVLKDWKKERSPDPSRIFQATKGRNWIWVAVGFKKYYVGIRNKNIKAFKTKSAALKYAKSYMRGKK